MKKYIVCYTLDRERKIKDGSGCIKHNYKDYYNVFIDSSSAINKKKAKEFFDRLINEQENIYTASICLIVESTDY